MKYLECKKIDTAISRAKKMLEEKVKSTGLYECFGQEEVRNIKYKFIDNTDYSTGMNINRMKLENFNNWCMTYTYNKKH